MLSDQLLSGQMTVPSSNPSGDDLAQHYAAALEGIRAAGDVASNYFAEIQRLSRRGGLAALRTEAEREVEAVLREALLRTTAPTDFINVHSPPERLPAAGCWVVTPIDGRTAFVHGLPSWCISLAYVDAGRLAFGMVFDPIRKELFRGGRSLPATVNYRAIQIDAAGSDFNETLVCFCPSSGTPVEVALETLHTLTQLGCTPLRQECIALSLCYVASGRLSAHVDRSARVWESLAGAAIVEAAGGTVTDILGEPLRRRSFIAAPPAIYEQIHAALAA